MIPGVKLDLLLIENHSALALSLADFSVYPTAFTPVSPTVYIKAGGFQTVTIPFTPNSINVYTSENLGITCPGECLQAIPDGIYKVKYTINPANENFVEKTFFRVYQLQEKFDNAFMKLDMMECDGAIRKQKQVELDTIYYFIQGAIAAANKCAESKAINLYRQAEKMLNQFTTNNCECNG